MDKDIVDDVFKRLREVIDEELEKTDEQRNRIQNEITNLKDQHNSLVTKGYNEAFRRVGKEFGIEHVPLISH